MWLNIIKQKKHIQKIRTDFESVKQEKKNSIKETLFETKNSCLFSKYFKDVLQMKSVRWLKLLRKQIDSLSKKKKVQNNKIRERNLLFFIKSFISKGGVWFQSREKRWNYKQNFASLKHTVRMQELIQEEF